MALIKSIFYIKNRNLKKTAKHKTIAETYGKFMFLFYT